VKRKHAKRLVFFQGAYDLINAGHIRAIKLAKKQGDYLVIGLNSDELMSWYKREPIVPYNQRAEIIDSIKWVDEIIECHEPSAFRYLKQLKAKVYVLTDEWKEQQKKSIKYIESIGGQVVFSPRWSDILCSTDLRAKIIEGGK